MTKYFLYKNIQSCPAEKTKGCKRDSYAVSIKTY